MIAFFVAREAEKKENGSDGEFSRYLKAANVKEESLKEFMFTTERSSGTVVVGTDPGPTSFQAISIKANHQERTADYRVRYFVAYSGGKSDGARTVVLEMTKYKDMMKEMLDSAIVRGSFNKGKEKGVRKEVNDFLGIFRNIGKEINGGKGVVDSDINIFIHWGSGNPLAYERVFSGLVRRSDYPMIKVFALSTRRPEFNVCKSEIDVPRGDDELRSCVARFVFHQIKNPIMEYIHNFESGKGKRFGPDESGLLVLYLEEMMRSGIRREFPDDDETWMLKAAAKLKKELLTNNNINMIESDESLVALLTLLVRKEISRG